MFSGNAERRSPHVDVPQFDVAQQAPVQGEDRVGRRMRNRNPLHVRGQGRSRARLRHRHVRHRRAGQANRREKRSGRQGWFLLKFMLKIIIKINYLNENNKSLDEAIYKDYLSLDTLRRTF